MSEYIDPMERLKRSAARMERIESGALKSATATDEKLFEAIESKSLDAVQLALKAGADVNSTNRTGATPLHYAIPGWDSGVGFASEEEVLPIVKALVEAGADVNAVDPSNDNWTPVISAAFAVEDENYMEILKFLLRSGADKGARDSRGMTALEILRSKDNYKYRHATKLLEEA